MGKDRGKALVESISKSQLYKDYERAFSETTRLPLTFRPAEIWNLPQSGKKYENPFCALIAKHNASCATCLDQQQQLSDRASQGTHTQVCFAGLCESAIPVKLGNDLLGFLQTGQVAFKKPTKALFSKVTSQLIEWGVTTDLGKFEEAFFHSQVISKAQYDSMLKLLEVFAQHLAMSADQIAIQQENAEPPPITKAKEFINERKGEDMSLNDVAKVVNMSTFHFCKMFKKSTGLTFTEYLSLVRIAKAKNLLLNPNLRVSEIAYEVGFQSLTHFNRIFRKMVGESPSQYREKLPRGGLLAS
jgi:AraC-like DNA-binding protein